MPSKLKQLKEVTYEQIANAFNRKDLVISPVLLEFKDNV
jgi:UDP-N-acetylmuramate: L-alanyl-gamma-D-glutamyl-meso-diaminopimelate ligase